MNHETELLLDNLPENINMTTKVWGGPIWFFLHNVAMAYPKHIRNTEKDQKTLYYMRQFIISLGYVLPCEVCRDSYHKFIKELKFMDGAQPEPLHSRKKLIKFFYDLHNKVNHKLGVPKCDIPSLDNIVTYYKKFIARGCKATTSEEKATKKLQGCQNKDFVDYTTFIKILDKNDNKYESINGKENFGNFDNSCSINLVLLVLLIIAIIVIGILLCYKK